MKVVFEAGYSSSIFLLVQPRSGVKAGLYVIESEELQNYWNSSISLLEKSFSR